MLCLSMCQFYISVSVYLTNYSYQKLKLIIPFLSFYLYETMSSRVHYNIPNESNNRKRSRAWVYTLNNYGEGEYESISCLEATYHIYARERGAKGTRHIQGYIRFRDAVSRSTMSKRIPRAYVAKAMGTPEEASNYCKKAGDYQEVGVLPMNQVDKGNANKSRYARAWDLAKKGDIDTLADESPHILITNYQTILKIKRDYNTRPADLEFLQNEWVYGVPLTGKSAYCNSLCPDTYIKSCNKWWMGYQANDVVHINDFGKSHSALGHHLKIWGDLYAFMGEDKNGGAWMRLKRVMVSSNYHPRDIWPDDPMMVAAILRRYKLIYAQRTSLVDTFGYLFSGPTAPPRDDDDEEECPDAPISPGPGSGVFDLANDVSVDSTSDIRIICSQLSEHPSLLSDISLDIDILESSTQSSQ